jgi:uncharacterized protein RhaS with RHS repeats
LYNYGYRDYNPVVARFTSEDPVRDGVNWFAYVNNDPVNFVDLWGLEPLFICDKLYSEEKTKDNGMCLSEDKYRKRLR